MATCTASTRGLRRVAIWRRTRRGAAMAKKLDRTVAAEAREDARGLEQQADSTEPYPADTVISWPNAPSRMFNVRLSEEQYEALQELAHKRHLPMSTMARAWLLDRLDHERRAS